MQNKSANQTRDLFDTGPQAPAPAAPQARPAQAAKAVQAVQAAQAERKPVETGSGEAGYTARDIEVLEGLEPVRRRPGMYIGGTDEKAMHHLFAEALDNSMDEAVAGHASWIEVSLDAQGWLTVTDNGRGIPVDPHPKFPDKSALEVIMTTLHAGGKFDSNVYETSGGLHGVGISVVNALSERLEVEVARGQKLYRQDFARGQVLGRLAELGAVKNRRGTKVRFRPDTQIFGPRASFKPARLFAMARTKAYLFAGVEIRWRCAPELLDATGEIPAEAVLHFPGGLKDYLGILIKGRPQVTPEMFTGVVKAKGGHGSVEWAVAWFAGADGFLHSYCNTIPTTDGGTHVAGLRAALSRSLKTFGDLAGNRRAQTITAEDVTCAAGAMLSVFIREPEFQGQTKERLATQEAARIVETAVRDTFDHWLTENPNRATRLLDWVIERADERIARRQEREVNRKAATRRLRLPGKLADCSRSAAADTEIFIVEGDSAGGSAKQARDRKTQAVLPLRGKILNVANATPQKLAQNQLLGDLIQALGCGTRSAYCGDDLRYEKVIIMTDADVDGAHIASLLITFFYREMPALIETGHLYLAVPPLYRISQGGKTAYARDDAHREALLASEFTGRGKIDIGRFKGLGEMMALQLKETTMSRKTRTLLRVCAESQDASATASLVERLMGNKPEARFAFIQERAEFADNLDI